MKSKLFLALLLASLLAVLLIPTGAALAAPQSPDSGSAADQLPASGAAAAEAQAEPQALTQQPPIVQIAIGLVAVLFGCLAFAPLASADRLAAYERQ